MQLLEEVKTMDLVDKLRDFFCSNVLATAGRLQSVSEQPQESLVVTTDCLDPAGEVILACIEGLSKVKVQKNFIMNNDSI